MGNSKGETWENKGYITVYRDQFVLNIKSKKKNIKGCIILPDRNTKTLNFNLKN